MESNPRDDEGAGADDDEEWRFSLEDIEQRVSGDDTDSEDDGGNIAGTFTPSDDIEAGDIDFENAFFVLVGVVLAVLAIAGFMNLL